MSGRKALKDLRGPQRRIGRLVPFLFGGFVHVLAYRIMVPLTLVFAAWIAAYLFAGARGAGLKAVAAVVWVVWTPQIFRVARGLALSWSRGMAFGRMNPEFAALYRKRYSKGASGGYVAFPFVVLAVWAAGFVAMLAGWRP